MKIAEKPILEIQNITKTYRTKPSILRSSREHVVALNNISLHIFRGEIFGLVGESGSGKTTVGRLIVRLEEADEGKIDLDGVAVTGLKRKILKDFRRRVQMIFQDPYQSLNPQISVFRAIAEPLKIHKMGNSQDIQDMVREALKSVGLSPPDQFMHRYPHRLSGGQRQRVAIARAMVLNPTFIVADEPTSMLDASISAQIFNILLGLRDHLNVTQLFITHSLAAARYLCDRIAVIYRGNLMEIGPSDDVIGKPKHPYTQALIDALPKFRHIGDAKRYGTLLTPEREAQENIGCPFYPNCRVAHRIRCSQAAPPLEEIGPSHVVACFYAEQR